MTPSSYRRTDHTDGLSTRSVGCFSGAYLSRYFATVASTSSAVVSAAVQLFDSGPTLAKVPGNWPPAIASSSNLQKLKSLPMAYYTSTAEHPAQHVLAAGALAAVDDRVGVVRRLSDAL